jgi:hypothetical protein
MHGDVFLDGGVEFRDALEHATAQTAGGDIGGQLKIRKFTHVKVNSSRNSQCFGWPSGPEFALRHPLVGMPDIVSGQIDVFPPQR